MNRVIDLVARYYKVVLALTILLTLPFLYYYFNQNYYNNVGIYFEDNDSDIEYYKSFQQTFGNEESIAIVFKTENVFTVKNLQKIRAITEAVHLIPGVQRVYSLTNTELVVGKDDLIDFEMLVPAGEINQKSVNSAKEKSHNYYSIFGSIISKDGKTTAIIVEIKPVFSNNEKQIIFKQLIDAAEKTTGEKPDLHYAGAPCLDIEINALTYFDNMKFTPLTFIIIFILIVLLLRNLTLSILCQINIMLIVLWGVGFLILTGESINTVTVIIAPILLAISTADSIHILNYYQELFREKGQHKKSIINAVKVMWLPCFFTSITTATGYFSFLITDVRPVRIVGIYTGAGLLLAFIMSVTFLPAILIAFSGFFEKKGGKHTGTVREGKINKNNILFEKFGLFIVNNHKSVILFFIIVTSVAAFGITKVKFETDFASYLKDSNRIKKDMKFVESNMRGTVPVEIVLTALSGDYDFTRPGAVRILKEIQEGIMQHMQGRYSSSYSVADYLMASNKAFNEGNEEYFILPETRNDIIDLQEFCDDKILSKYLSPDRMEARISFTSYFGATEYNRQLEQYIENNTEGILNGKFKIRFTGISALYTKMDRNLKTSQIKSFGMAFIIIFIMMIIICKNFKLALISMIPNLFPVVVTIGMMGWAKIPLDVSTIMIASVTIGIAVDDTIHYIIWLKRNVFSGMEMKTAIVKTYSDAGRPVIMTTIVLCLAYFVLASGSVKPIISFGIFAGFAMFLALIGDLCILPAVIVFAKPDLKKRWSINV